MYTKLPVKNFPELAKLESLIENAPKTVKISVQGTVQTKKHELPIYTITIGTTDRSKPTLGLFGGVHGLERIGSQCVLAYLDSLFEQMRWDEDLNSRLQDVRIVSIPIVNPGGMLMGTRSNPKGVDLMRNSPVEAHKSPPLLLGGHRMGRWLPYFRGDLDAGLEVESKTLTEFVRAEMFEAESAMALDVHSGFGVRDRLWYPFARSREPFPRENDVKSLESLLNKSYPNHVYVVEPQALVYTTHGDLWDYLFDEHHKIHGSTGPLFLPWTLELGSWMWVRKNPLQIFSSLGIFNPIKAHRFKRTLRRHLPLFDFLLRAIRNYKTWSGISAGVKAS